MEIAHVRILRLAAGTGLSLWVSQAVGWDLSFIAPVITLFILALPLPALKLKQGILILAAMTLSMYSSLLLLPWLLDYQLVGLLLLVLALYWSFYFTAKGGSPVLGTFITMGIALSTAVGSVSVDATLMLIRGLIMNAVIGILFVWIAHALLPDSMAGGFPAPDKPQDGARPDLADARWSAFRSLVIVFPIAFWFMLSGASTSYVPVMIKVASMGQQATNEGARLAGRSLILSTIYRRHRRHHRLERAERGAKAVRVRAAHRPRRPRVRTEGIQGHGHASGSCHLVVCLPHDDRHPRASGHG